MGSLPAFAPALRSADERGQVFLTVNDELRASQQVEPFDNVLKDFLGTRMPTKSPWELEL